MTSVVGRFVSGITASGPRKNIAALNDLRRSGSGGSAAYFPPPAELKKLILREGTQSDAATVTMSARTFNKLLEAAMAGQPFDEQAYLDRCPDVKAAVKAGKIKSGFRHFVSNGYFEQRAAFDFPVDETWYTDTYKDVADAIASGAFHSASHHFEQSGFFEGRAPSKQALPEYGEWLELINRFPAPV